jgi:hypothetical protein
LSATSTTRSPCAQRNGTSALHPPEALRLALGNGRNGATCDGPAANAERPLSLDKATLAGASSSGGLAPKTVIQPTRSEAEWLDPGLNRHQHLEQSSTRSYLSGATIDPGPSGDGPRHRVGQPRDVGSPCSAPKALGPVDVAGPLLRQIPQPDRPALRRTRYAEGKS